MRFLRLCSAALIAGIAVAGAMLFGLGLLDQAQRFWLYHVQGLAFHDYGCSVSFCDASVFWLAGRLAGQGGIATLYHAPAFAAYGAALLPGHLDHLPFVYPPVMLLVAVALSRPPLALAYIGFTLTSVIGAILLLRRAGMPWPAILLGLGSPAAMWSIYLGQFGLLCGALLIAGLSRLGRRPAEAGLWLGLLAIKPQYALAAPVAVLAGRHWRAMAAGIVVTAALVALSCVWFGVGAWAAFFGPGRAAARFLLAIPFWHGEKVLGISVFWMLRSLGAGLGFAAVVQLVVSLLAIVGMAWLWRRPVDPEARLVATLCLSLLAVPYGYTDDMAALSVALPLLWRRGASFGNLLLAVVWVSPALTGDFLKYAGLLPEPLFIAAALLFAMRESLKCDDIKSNRVAVRLNVIRL